MPFSDDEIFWMNIVFWLSEWFRDFSRWSWYNRSFIEKDCSVDMAGYWPWFRLVTYHRSKKAWATFSHLDFTLGHDHSGFYVGFIVWGSLSYLGGSGGMLPRILFWIDMRWDAIWCILRHNFKKCYNMRTDLVASAWFFRYSYLYTVMITIFWGGGVYPSNILRIEPYSIRYGAYSRANLFWSKTVWP